MRYYDITTAPPSDREYARLVRRRAGLTLDKKPMRTYTPLDWALVVGGCTAFVTVIAVRPDWFMFFDRMVSLAMLVLPLLLLRQAVGHVFPTNPLDRMLQRPDLAPCTRCAGVADIVDEGRAVCRACEHAFEARDVAPRVPPLHAEQESVTDEQWHAIRASVVRGTLRARFVLVGSCAACYVVLMPASLESLMPERFGASGGPHLWTAASALALFVALFWYVNDGVTRGMRRLATRPDLVDPRTTFLPWYSAGLGRRRL